MTSKCHIRFLRDGIPSRIISSRHCIHSCLLLVLFYLATMRGPRPVDHREQWSHHCQSVYARWRPSLHLLWCPRMLPMSVHLRTATRVVVIVMTYDSLSLPLYHHPHRYMALTIILCYVITCFGVCSLSCFICQPMRIRRSGPSGFRDHRLVTP